MMHPLGHRVNNEKCNFNRRNDMKKLPKELLIYVCDYDDVNKPIYAVAENVNEIPEDCDGEMVGNYTLNRTSKFKVKRELS
jgi:hypothetical protein